MPVPPSNSILPVTSTQVPVTVEPVTTTSHVPVSIEPVTTGTLVPATVEPVPTSPPVPVTVGTYVPVTVEPVTPVPVTVEPVTTSPDVPATIEPAGTASAPVVVAPTPTPAGPNRSGLPWASGVYVRGSSPAAVEAFAAWRGRPVDVVVDWAARATWSDVVDPSWLYRAWANTPYTKVFGIAPIPEQDPSATMAGCAAGAYNDKWVQFARTIHASGLEDQTIIRLGWEFNGDWYKWRATDAGQFARCWQQIVGTVEKFAPALRWDWSVNRGRGQSVADPRAAYPGDDYVDIVGVDSYDMWPGATDEAGWQQQYAGDYGLKFWADFAAEHGKLLSVPEWGVYPGTAHAGHNGGDNAFYIAKMTAFFRSQGSRLAYEAYFNENASYYAGSLYSPAQAPTAAAAYLTALTG